MKEPHAGAPSASYRAEDLDSRGPSPRPSWIRFRVVALLCAAAAVAYMSRNCISVAKGDIAVDLTLSELQMGAVMSAFFWSYALAQIPSGWLGHTWGVRRSLTFYAVMWSVAVGVLGLAGGLWSIVAAQLLFGAAQAGIFPCSADAISKWIPTARRALVSGSLASCMSLGGAGGAALTGLLLDDTGPNLSWRWMFALFALPGIAWAACFYGWFRNRPEQHTAVNVAELALIRAGAETAPTGKAATHDAPPWGAIAASPDMWFICGQQFFRAAGYIFFATWFPSFLKDMYGVSTKQSGLLTSLPLLGVVLGGVLGGFTVDWVYKRTGSLRWSRQGVAIFALLGSAGFILAAYFVTGAAAAVMLISAGSLLASLGGSCGYTVTIDKAGRHVAPIFGAMNMSGNIGAAICPVVVGWIFHLSENRAIVLLLFVGIYIAAALCWALLNPNGLLASQSNPTKRTETS